MDADERDICNYLKSWPGQFVYGRDIARRAAGKWRFRKDPGWAAPVLARLVEKGIVQADATGHYRLRIKTGQEKEKKWISPQIKSILQRRDKERVNPIYNLDEDEDSEGKSDQE